MFCKFLHVYYFLGYLFTNTLLLQGSFPSPCGPEASSSLLPEDDIIALLPSSRKSVSICNCLSIICITYNL